MQLFVTEWKNIWLFNTKKKHIDRKSTYVNMDVKGNIIIVGGNIFFPES